MSGEVKHRVSFGKLLDQNGQASFWASYGALATIMVATIWIPLPAAIQMLTYTLPIIFVGSHMGLHQKEINPETGERSLKVDAINNRDAMLFPFVGSVALLSLYFAYKYLPTVLVNMIVSTYLTFFGIAALGETLRDILSRIPATKSYDFVIFSWKVPMPARIETYVGGPLELTLSPLQVAAYAIGLVVGVFWAFTNHWVLHNMLACAFSIQGISLVSVGSFRIASTLLSGLFIYDILWVFFTDVMVTVAKSFRAPAKLIFPLSHNPWKQSILGLGDVVVPGVFIAMVLRYDWHRYQQILEANLVPSAQEDHNGANALCNEPRTQFSIFAKFPKKYFRLNMIGYTVALLVTAGILNFTGHAQPALLYLVPGCLGALFVPALWFKEFTHVWNYSEEEENNSDDQEDDDKSSGMTHEPVVGPSGKDHEESNANKLQDSKSSDSEAEQDTSAVLTGVASPEDSSIDESHGTEPKKTK